MRNLEIYSRGLPDFFGGNLFPQVLKDFKEDFQKPSMNLSKREGKYVYEFEVPGFNKEDISLELKESNYLVIQGDTTEERTDEEQLIKERSSRSFRRTVLLPKDVDVDTITARVENGVLEISVNQSEETAGKIIPID